MLKIPADRVFFMNEEQEEMFDSLPENHWLKKAINKAKDSIKENVFCGERIRKEIIPKKYIKDYKIDNLLWYPLPNAWRLVYSIFSDADKKVLGAIIEFYDHKSYERRFGY